MSKKVGIVTFHFANNFGAALQTYGLTRAIEEACDAQAQVVDYRNWFIRFTDTVRLLPITTNMAEIKSGLKTISQRLGRVQKFKAFHNAYYKMTRRFNASSSKMAKKAGCDKYVCGSDQIWNPVLTFGVAKPYFLAFDTASENKISYAPSFGVFKMSDRNRKKMQKYISNLGAISVRESEGIDIVKNLVGKDAIQLIDPTFLVTKEEWSQVAVKPEISEKYILLYIMQRNDTVYEYARKVKEKLGLPIVAISRYGYQPDFVDKCLIDVGPREWVGLFENAEFVCTNSFHGLAFSIIFEKNFYLVPSKKFNTRMASLLKILAIEGTYNLDEADLSCERYDRVKIRATIESEKEKSFEFLKKYID